MLVGNLAIPEYVEVVVGSLDKLPEKLAQASRCAGTYSHWRGQQQPFQTGRLPRRLLAQENFLENLLGVCDAAGKEAGLCQSMQESRQPPFGTMAARAGHPQPVAPAVVDGKRESSLPQGQGIAKSWTAA